MHRKKIIAVTLLLPFAMGGCFGNYFSSRNVEREGMPVELQTRLEKEITKGEKMLAEAKDEKAKQEALLEIAFSNEQLGKFEEAIPVYEKMLTADPVSFQALNNLGVIYEELKEYEKSATYYARLLAANPDNTETLDDTLRVLVLMEKFDEARKTLDDFSENLKKNKTITPELNKFIANQLQKIVDAKSKTTSNEK
jgi:tetratricopeptide (TPR) repeat protein